MSRMLSALIVGLLLAAAAPVSADYQIHYLNHHREGRTLHVEMIATDDTGVLPELRVWKVFRFPAGTTRAEMIATMRAEARRSAKVHWRERGTPPDDAKADAAPVTQDRNPDR